MQQAIQTIPAIAIPNLNIAMSKSDSSRIEGDALNIQAGLGGSLSFVRSSLSQLKMLLGMVGKGKQSAQAQSTITSAIAKAKSRIEQLESEENSKGGSVDLQAKFELVIYGLMSVRAKKFYDSIDENSTFHLAHVNEDGELSAHKVKHIDGKSIKRLLSLIKFHSLDTANKKKVLYDTFGAEAAEEEGTPKDKETLVKKKKELLELHEALDTIEAYKAYMITRKFKPDVAAAMIDKNHQAIIVAHDQIDEVARKYDELIADVNNGMAMATLKVAKLKMKKILKDDVIDHILLDQPVTATAQTISGGMPALETLSGFAGFSSIQPAFAMPVAN